MPNLTRRRSPDAERETWLIHYGDIQVGTISERADADQWSWAVGFYPASHRGVRAVRDHGTGCHVIDLLLHVLKHTDQKRAARDVGGCLAHDRL